MEISRIIEGLGTNVALLEFLGQVRTLLPNTLGNCTRADLAIFLVDDGISGQGIALIQDALDGINALTVTKNKAAILTNGVDTVTFSHVTVEPSVKWFCYKDGALYASGQEAAVAGVVSLTLAVNAAGIYALHILNLDGIGSGFSQVIAEDA